MNKIITISREFGSGGREIGRRLAEAMKIAYYDQEIVAALIKRTKKAEEYVHYMEKERPLPLLPITTARTFGLPTNYCCYRKSKLLYAGEQNHTGSCGKI